MEFVVEFLFELILEGSIELGSEKSVPMPLRILAAIVVCIFFFGMGGFCIYTAYDEYMTHAAPVVIVMFAFGVFMIGGGIALTYKMFKKKKEIKNKGE